MAWFASFVFNFFIIMLSQIYVIFIFVSICVSIVFNNRWFICYYAKFQKTIKTPLTWGFCHFYTLSNLLILIVCHLVPHPKYVKILTLTRKQL